MKAEVYQALKRVRAVIPRVFPEATFELTDPYDDDDAAIDVFFSMTKEQLKQLENNLWAAADNLRANSDLKASEYSTPVLGLIFLKFADNNYRRHEPDILEEYKKLKGTRREKADFRDCD